MRTAWCWTFIGLCCLAQLGCKQRANSSGILSEDAAKPAKSKEPMMCTGIRGNGPKIMTLFMGMARQTELFGSPEGTVGGSSGSITSFLYESIVTNPNIAKSCNARSCTTDESNLRVALLLKSLVGYFSDVSDKTPKSFIHTIMNVPDFKDERSQTQTGGNWVQRKLSEVRDNAIAKKLQAEEVASIVRQTLENSDLRDLVEPTIFDELVKSVKTGDPKRIKTTFDILMAAIKGLGDFSTDGPELVLRPRVLNWANLAKRFGIIGDFYGAGGYEGRADYLAAFNTFVDRCGTQAVSYDKDWLTIAQTDVGGKTCLELFKGWLATHRPDSLTRGVRINELIGARPRFDGKRQHTIAVTSVVVDNPLPHPNAVEKWEKARERFLLTGKAEGPIDWGKMGVGYWGQSEDLNNVLKNKEEYYSKVSPTVADGKAERFVPIGTATWLEILSLSPAEPGSSPVTTVSHLSNDGRVIASGGGWADHNATFVMRGMGCDTVTFLSRGGPDLFTTKIAKIFGIDAYRDSYDRIYNEDVAGSGYSRAFRYADTTFCSNWDDPKYGGGINGLIQMADDYYQGPITVITDPKLYPDALSPDVLIRRNMIEQKLAHYKDLVGKDYPRLTEAQLGCGYRFAP